MAAVLALILGVAPALRAQPAPALIPAKPQSAAPLSAAPAPAAILAPDSIPTIQTSDQPGSDLAGKAAPKPGQGANDAGDRATSLRTTRMALFSLIDRSVVGREKREIGHVVDVLINAKGQPAALVVDVGGFMGMGNRRIAIGWERFMLAGHKPDDALLIPFSDAQVRAAPAVDGSREVTVVQGAVEPPPARASLGSSRVDLGEDPGPLSNDAAAHADPLNPD